MRKRKNGQAALRRLLASPTTQLLLPNTTAATCARQPPLHARAAADGSPHRCSTCKSGGKLAAALKPPSQRSQFLQGSGWGGRARGVGCGGATAGWGRRSSQDCMAKDDSFRVLNRLASMSPPEERLWLTGHSGSASGEVKGGRERKR